MATGLVRKVVRGIAALALAVFAVPALAVFYSSNFDPAEMRGTGLFRFDDACLAVDGLHQASDCHLTLLSAQADILNDGTGGTGHVDFAPVLPNSADMFDLVISDGTLVGVDTDLIGHAFASPCTGTACGVPWWIQWISGFADPVTLTAGSCSEGCSVSGPPTIVAPNVTFTRVPEPATLALVLGALTACGFARRRRS